MLQFWCRPEVHLVHYPTAGSGQLHKSNRGLILSFLSSRNSIWLPYCIAGYRIILFVHIYSYGGLQVPYVFSEKYFLLLLSNLVSNYLYCLMNYWFLCTFAALNLIMFPKLSSSSLKPLLTSMTIAFSINYSQIFLL